MASQLEDAASEAIRILRLFIMAAAHYNVIMSNGKRRGEMDMLKDDEESISDEMSLFATRAELIEYLLLKFLSSNGEPVGSWVLKVELELKDVAVSTATIGRVLKDMDAKGYTRLVGAQGRVITEKGASWVEEISNRLQRERLQRNLIDAAQPENLQELLDLLHARKAIECETAKLAAQRADAASLEALKEHMACHEQCVERSGDPSQAALNFHAMLAKASGNKFLMAALDILIYEEWKLEQKINELVTRKRGVQYADQHRGIVEAIMRGDAEEAGSQMKRHMEDVIEDVKQQIAQESEGSIAGRKVENKVFAG